jgi:hypothetical protein
MQEVIERIVEKCHEEVYFKQSQIKRKIRTTKMISTEGMKLFTEKQEEEACINEEEVKELPKDRTEEEDYFKRKRESRIKN